ncbi:hypothetical protein OG389_35415 [Streptomyces sp. NBC_00435]|uniref:hypothetical protein n=1 Tax=Streptomyces sp. NBC_00435 TaxID=2903649 RepID=UPI002E243FA1
MTISVADVLMLGEPVHFAGRLRSDVSTALEPLLDHPDVGGDALSTAHCAAIGQ